MISTKLPAADTTIYLDKITLQGLKTLSSVDMINSLKLEPKQIYSPEFSLKIKEELQTYLNQRGYYFATIEQSDIVPTSSNRVNLEFRIEEGFAGYLSNLRLEGNIYFSSDKVFQLAGLPQPNRIKLTDLPQIMSGILQLYLSRSFLFAKVELDSLIENKDGMEAVIDIHEGPVFIPEKYLFTGNKVTKPATLLKISGLSQVIQFTPEAIESAEKRLLAKPYIENCSITPLDGKSLRITVEEARMTRIEGILGLTTNPANQRRTLSGYLNLQFLNLWGTDRSVGLDWRKPNANYSKLDLSYHESGLNKYPVAGDLLFQNVQQDTSWKTVKIDLNLYYVLNHNKLGTHLYSETLYPGSEALQDLETTKDYRISAFWQYDNTDYAANPTKGMRLNIKGGWLFSHTESGSRNYPVTETDAATYLKIWKRYVYSPGIHYRELANRKASVNEVYYLGGINNLRGYLEDAFNGWRVGWTNHEFSYLMTRDSRVFVFFDAGIVQSGQGKIQTDLMGAGVGISVATRLGIVNFDYGLPVSANRFTGLGSGILHVGLVSSF